MTGHLVVLPIFMPHQGIGWEGNDPTLVGPLEKATHKIVDRFK